MLNKRGLSPVIAVVLLIMITVVAAGIIIAFVIPFVRDVGQNGQECFEVSTKLSVGETGFNCYAGLTGQENTGFSIKIDDARIVEVSVSLLSQGEARNFRLKDGFSHEDLRMVQVSDANYGEPIILPKVGETKTYVVKGKYEQVEIAPILESGNACDPVDDALLNSCALSSNAATLISSP